MDAYTKDFIPQPYLQLAKTVREAGYDRAADDILVRLERNRTRWGDQRAWRQLGSWVYDGLLRRGSRPFRPLTLLIAVWLVNAVAFNEAYYAGNFVPSKNNLASQEQMEWNAHLRSASNNKVLVRFDARTYAFGLIVPLIKIEGDQNWAFRSPPDGDAHVKLGPLSRIFEWLAHWLIVIDPIAGWVLTSFLVAGIAGLSRSPSAGAESKG
jgi:hypothetical protein